MTSFEEKLRDQIYLLAERDDADRDNRIREVISSNLRRDGAKESVSYLRRELRDAGFKKLGNFVQFVSLVERLGFETEEIWRGGGIVRTYIREKRCMNCGRIADDLMVVIPGEVQPGESEEQRWCGRCMTFWPCKRKGS